MAVCFSLLFSVTGQMKEVKEKVKVKEFLLVEILPKDMKALDALKSCD